MRLSKTRCCIYLFCIAILHLANTCVCSAEITPSSVEAKSLFDFHSGFWINLHHFLYLEALSGRPTHGPHPAILSQSDLAAGNSLSASERAVWNKSVAYYTDSIIQHDLLFDQNMGIIKNHLEDAENSSDLTTVEIPADLKAVLLQAAPIYRNHWWPRHDAQNRQWIAQVKPLTEKYGEGLKDSLARIYEEPWPGNPMVRVDATVYAGQFGAYTTDEPTRPTISTTDPANQGIAALEIVFHETSHGMMDKVIDTLHTAENEFNAKSPESPFHAGTLWHAVLFYTAGELVAEQVPNYLPYADKNGLWIRAWPNPDRSLIEQDWKPHVHGQSALQPALTKLVTDLASAQKQK